MHAQGGVSTAAEAPIHKYFDGSRVLDAAGRRWCSQKSSREHRWGGGEAEKSRKTLMVTGMIWSKWQKQNVMCGYEQGDLTLEGNSKSW